MEGNDVLEEGAPPAKDPLRADPDGDLGAELADACTDPKDGFEGLADC